MTVHRKSIMALTAHYRRLPAIYYVGTIAVEGGFDLVAGVRYGDLFRPRGRLC